MRYEVTKDLETGNALIDSEHRELFRAINGLMDACSQGKGREQVEKTCQFLVSYVAKHFKDEENLQIQSGYPEYRSHKMFHENYKKQIEADARAMAGKPADISALSRMNNTISVLVNHIKREDKKLAEYVRSHK